MENMIREPLKGRRRGKRQASGLAAALCLAAALVLSGCQSRDAERRQLRLEGIEKLENGDYEGAIQALETALEHSGGMVGELELDILRYRAEAEYKAGDYQAAAYTYEVLLKADAEREEYRFPMCMLRIRAGELDKAREAFDQLYAKKPQDPKTIQALLFLGDALTEAGRPDEAQALYEQAARDNTGSGEIYNRLGLCRLRDGKTDEAIRYLEQGLATGDEPARAALLLSQAAAYEKKLDFAKALELLKQYAAAYGATPQVQKEMDFLSTR